VREEPSPSPSPSPAAPEPELEPKPAPSLGVSLWHKIFGSPDEQAERIAESTSAADTERRVESEQARDDRPGDERHGRSGRRHEETPSDRATEEIAEASESWREESAEIEFVETRDAEDRAGKPTDEEGEPRRRRRRRGRGRGRGRRPEGEQGGEERSSGQLEQRTDGPREPRAPRAEREPRGRGGHSGRPRRESPRQQDDLKDDLDDDLDDGLEEIVLDDDRDTDELDLGVDGEDAAESTDRAAPAGHKSIPSWDEAIGMIVDTNLATRTDQRRSAPSQSRGSGSSRGRPRGGRRRKKS
jgi:ribonuclease E